MASTTVPTATPRARIRDVLPGIHIGTHKPGPLNAITDVPGVRVHTQSLRLNNGSVNTGVTTILPRENWFEDACYAGIFRFNGAGEMTGSHWLEETGLLSSPVVLTNTFAVGLAYQGVYEHAIAHHGDADGNVDWFILPVVAETWDGHLNDLSTFAVQPHHVVAGIEGAKSGPVAEGNTGGGTGMICHGHKGGTGTSSRVVAGLGVDVDGDGNPPTTTYTVAALVQANYGRLAHLRVAGAPVGRLIGEELERKQQAATTAEGDGGGGLSAADAERARNYAEAEAAKDKKDGSIIVVLATDAPLHPLQLQRLAKRATVGLSRVGGYGHNPSGDLFLAFSTANEVPVQKMTTAGKRADPVDPWRPAAMSVEVINDKSINPLFEAAADATEEAIYNALCMAETMVGHKGKTIQALDLEQLKSIMAKYI